MKTTSSGEKATLALVLGLALFLRVYHLEFHSLWVDELVTWFECWRPSFASFWAEYSRLELTPPLYFLTEFTVSRIFSATEISLRIMSVLFGVGFTVASALFAHELSGRRKYAAAIGGLFAATCYRSIVFSQEARCYSLLLFLAALSGWAWLRLDSSPGRLRGSHCKTYFTAAVALAYTHYFGVLLVCAQFLSIGFLRSRANWKYWLKLYLAIALAYTPWLYFLATHPLPGGSNVKAPPPLSEVFVAHRELFGSSSVNSLLALVLAIAAVALGRTAWRKLSAVFSWVFVVFFLALMISYFKPIYSIRYYILVLAPMLAVAAAGAVEIAQRKKWLGWSMALLFAFLGIYETAVGRGYYSSSTEQQVREASQTAVALMHKYPDAAVVLISFPEFLYPYYFDRFKAPKKADHEFDTVADFVHGNAWIGEHKTVIALIYTYSEQETEEAYRQIAASGEFPEVLDRHDFHEASVAVFGRP